MGSTLSSQILRFTMVGAGCLVVIIFAGPSGIFPGDGELWLFLGAFFTVFVFVGAVFTVGARFFEGGSDAPSSSSTVSDDVIEQIGTDFADFRDDGAAAVADAETALAEGNLSAALASYTEARELYQTAVEMADDTDTQDELTNTIEQLQVDHEELQALIDERESLSQTLSVGLERLQTAIVAHSRGEETLARVRYRQARDQFATAIADCEATDAELFVPPLDVSVADSAELALKPIDEIRGIDAATATALVDRDITTVEELQQAVGSDDEPVVALGLDADGSVDAAVADRLTALCWWGGAESQPFDDLEDISRRREQAAGGFDATK